MKYDADELMRNAASPEWPIRDCSSGFRLSLLVFTCYHFMHVIHWINIVPGEFLPYWYNCIHMYPV